VGRKKVMQYRVVAADSRMKRDGRFLEIVGTYEPQANPKKFDLKTERIAYWLKVGAQPSETVSNLLRQDRFFEKVEALGKGLTAETMNIERLPERTRKAKAKPKKSE
jgi:small subunit ribosomal protein S16